MSVSSNQDEPASGQLANEQRCVSHAYEDLAIEDHDKGMERFEAERYRGALPYLYSAVKVCPSDAGYRYDLARVQFRLSQRSAAFYSASRAVGLNPNTSQYDGGVKAINQAQIRSFQETLDRTAVWLKPIENAGVAPA